MKAAAPFFIALILAQDKGQKRGPRLGSGRTSSN